MKKLHWLTIGMVAATALLSACSSTPKKGAGRNGEYFNSESGRTGMMAGDSSIEIGSAEWKKLARFAQKNKCDMIQAVGGIEQHVFFAFDRSDVPEDAMAGIKAQAQYLLEHKNERVRVEGNADDRGSREYNIALGMRRANAVVSVLREAGVPSRQIEALSYGAEKPAALGKEDTSYSCNRRADIVFIK